MRHEKSVLSVLLAVSAGAVLSLGPPGQAVPPAAAATDSGQPNILLINLDDMRAPGTLGVMPRVASYFGQQGCTYTQNFSSTPLCSPSRASLFTGRFPHNTGITGNGLDAEIAAMDQSATFQGYLHASGYRTAMAGKFMNTVPLSRSPQYWDHWTFMTGGYTDVSYNVDGTVKKIPGYYSTVLGNQVVQDLNSFEQQDSTPWLIYVAPQAPHAPTTPDTPHANAAVPSWTYPASFNEADVSDKPSTVSWRGKLNATQVEDLRKAQLRTLMSVDDMVGQIVDEMNRLGEDQNTLAIFTSDNGYLWGEHRILDKRFPYTESQEVPLMMRWDGHITPGSTDDRLISNVDIVPTLLQAAGITPTLKHPLDGVSILSSTRRTELLTEYGRSLDSSLPPWAALRTDTAQYAEWYNATTGALTDREYYNLVDDPLQLVNLLGDGSTANDPNVASWSARLAAARKCVGSACVVASGQANAPPVAKMAVPTCSGLTCSFSAAGSTDTDGTITGYLWTFGDGATATGVAPSHTYAAPDTYQVSVTVIDDDNATGVATRTVAVGTSTQVSFRAGASASANTQRLVVTTPTTVKAGDVLLLLVAANRVDATLGVPTGWTRLDGLNDETLQSAVWWKVATAADAGAAVPVTASLYTKIGAQLLAYSGVDTGTPPTYAIRAETGSAATHRTPTVTATASSWLVSFWSDKTQSNTGWAAPAGVVQRLQTTGSGGGRISTLSADSGPLVAGSAGGLTATASSAGTMAVMWSIVLRPS